MSDTIDQANDYAEQARACYEAIARGHSTKALSNTGFCHYCEGRVSGTFCDADCRDDYQRERSQLQRLGRT